MANRASVPVLDTDNTVLFHACNRDDAARKWLARRGRDFALERVGFKPVVFRADPEIFGREYYRVSYAK